MKTKSKEINIKTLSRGRLMLQSLLFLFATACAALLSAASALATPPTFTGGQILGGSIYDTPGFKFYVTGTPYSSWTVYSLPEGNYVDDPQEIGTLEIGSDGTGYFEDDNGGSFDYSSQFYQLVSGEESSDIFGYAVRYVDYTEDRDFAAVQNPVIPLSSTVNDVLPGGSSCLFWHGSSGDNYDSNDTIFFDDSSFDYDYAWLGSGWDSGTSITFGYGETLWFCEFYGYGGYHPGNYPDDMISFIGIFVE